MSESKTVTPSSDRFNWLEKGDDDFPFYNGLPVKITNPQWLFVMVMVVIGFAGLFVPLQFFTTTVGQFIPAILFSAVPLLGLYLVASKHWTALFRKLRGMDFVWMFTFAMLNFFVTMIVGSVVMKFLGAAANETIAESATMSTSAQVLFFIKAGIQLFGEEVLTILPFLAIMSLTSSRMRFSRKKAIIAAWFGSALIFGLLHLSSYDWNLVQCVVVIGTARLILTLPYIMTKNILVCTGAHILNDYLIIGMTIWGASLNGG